MTGNSTSIDVDLCSSKSLPQDRHNMGCFIIQSTHNKSARFTKKIARPGHVRGKKLDDDATRAKVKAPFTRGKQYIHFAPVVFTSYF